MKYLSAVLIIILLFSSSCKKKNDTEQLKGYAVSTVYNKAMDYMANGKFYNARRYFEVIIDNAPNSKLFSSAKLGFADAYFFDRGTGAADALPEYLSYLVYFPNNAQAPYAQYMAALCYYTQISSADRDQQYSWKAIEQFNKLKNKYPDSTYAKLCDLKIDNCYKRIAQHEFMVGKFYYKVSTYKACEKRLKTLMEKYPHYYDKEETYFLYGRSLFELKKFDDAAVYYKKLLAEFPNTIQKDRVTEELQLIESGEAQKQYEKEKKEFIKKIKKKLKKRD